MASSGVKCNPSVKGKFEALQKGKAYRYLCYMIEDEDKSKGNKPAEVTLDEEGCCEATASKECGETGVLVEKLKDYLLSVNRPRYCIFDVRETIDGKFLEKIVFILWNLDSFKIKDKMRYASTKEAVIRECNGVHKAIQISDANDLSCDALLELFK